MIKIKRIVPFILAACMVFSLFFTLACSTAKELDALTLDTTNAKLDFSLGEEYRPTGLVVYANYANGETETVDLGAVTIDSSKFNPAVKGTYTVSVSYSYEEKTVSATYDVNVVDALFGGLVVTLKEGRKNRFDLSANNKTIDFTHAATWIEVRLPDANGNVDMNAAALSRDSYTVEVFKGSEKVTDLSGVNRGNYQICASIYDAKEDFTYWGFTNILIFDDVSSIEFKEGTLQQKRGLRETMTPTWKFTVTYNSGDTAVVEKGNVHLSIPSINPNVAKDNGSVVVKYREPDTREQSTTVNYQLTGVQANPDLAFLNFSDTDVFTASNTNEFIGTVEYNGGDASFNVIGGNPGGKCKIVSKSATISLPTGIVINGLETFSANQAYQSGGASSAANGKYITFTLDRNCEIYVYAKSNGDDDRCMYLETENDYAIITGVEGYLNINGVPTAYAKVDPASYSAHAVSVTGLSGENPADFSLTFDASVNVFGILIVFPEEEV